MKGRDRVLSGFLKQRTLSFYRFLNFLSSSEARKRRIVKRNIGEKKLLVFVATKRILVVRLVFC